MSESLLEAKGVVAGYVPEVDILNGCSVKLDQGEAVGIIGPNGAGKSTMLKTLFGQVDVRSGEITLRGKSILKQPTYRLVRMGIGYVPQTENTFLPLSVRENLWMGSWVHKRIQAQQEEAILALFPKLKERWDQRVAQMSGGERQMVAMARALIAGPDVLLLDEPSAGLSPVNQKAVFENITRVNEAGISVIIVEQNARACLEICDRAYVLDQGRNTFEGTSEQLLIDENVGKLYLGSLVGNIEDN